MIHFISTQENTNFNYYWKHIFTVFRWQKLKSIIISSVGEDVLESLKLLHITGASKIWRKHIGKLFGNVWY